ncbi:MAG: recombinase family protein [Acidobacteriota bacterium]|nr:recombinase family protein [Acidobacteriota bacterium]
MAIGLCNAHWLCACLHKQPGHRCPSPALKAAKWRTDLSERASGGRWDRPELHWLLDRLRPGDVLVVWKLDRLSRSLRDVLMIMERLGDSKAGFCSLTEAIDTTMPASRVTNLLIYHNVVSMSRALARMAIEGHQVSPDNLSTISPYQTEHINRYGYYKLRLDRTPEPSDQVLQRPPQSENPTSLSCRQGAVSSESGDQWVLEGILTATLIQATALGLPGCEAKYERNFRPVTTICNYEPCSQL